VSLLTARRDFEKIWQLQVSFEFTSLIIHPVGLDTADQLEEVYRTSYKTQSEKLVANDKFIRQVQGDSEN